MNLRHHKRGWFRNMMPETQALLIIMGLAIGLGMICAGLILGEMGY
jgi:hypothetical protein